MYLGCDLEVLVLLQQLLRVMDAGAGGRVRGQVEVPGVVDPLQRLWKTVPMISDCVYTVGTSVTQHSAGAESEPACFS